MQCEGTGCRVVVGGGDIKRFKTSRRVIGAGGALLEGLNTGGRVKVAVDVVKERIRTSGGVVTAGSVVIKRNTADCRISDAACEAEERTITYGGVAFPIASLRRWSDCQSRRQDIFLFPGY